MVTFSVPLPYMLATHKRINTEQAQLDHDVEIIAFPDFTQGSEKDARTSNEEEILSLWTSNFSEILPLYSTSHLRHHMSL